MILANEKIIIPVDLQKKLLQTLHFALAGASSSKTVRDKPWQTRFVAYHGKQNRRYIKTRRPLNSEIFSALQHNLEQRAFQTKNTLARKPF